MDPAVLSPAASAPRRLIFHIGDHKTGSTAIQYAFARGTVRLNSGGPFYPGQLAHNYLRTHMKMLAKGSADKQQDAGEALHKLARKIRKAGAGCSLISAEALETVEPQSLRQAVDRFFTRSADEIRVTAYVRPHLSRLLSSYTEQTKIGLTSESLADYANRMLDTGKFRYHPRFCAWRSAFGEAFILRPFVKAELHRGDVVADLLRYGFGEKGFEITGPAPANESLCLQDLMRLKLLQSHMQQLPQALRHALGWEFARLIGTLPPPAAPVKLQLHRKLAQRLHDAYLEDARAMDHDFFGGDPLLETELDQALKVAVESPQKLDPAAHLEAEEIRLLTLMAQMVSGMLENSSVNWVRHFRLQRIAALKDGAP